MNTKSYERRKGNLMPVSKKQLYLLTACLLIVCISQAQIKKGDILLGGNVGFTTQNSQPGGGGNKVTQTNYTISPSIGKAIKDDLVVGLNLNYAHFRAKTGDNPANITNDDTYGLGVFVRKYKVLGAGFAFFGEGDLGGTYERGINYTEGQPKPPASRSYGINGGFYPGIAYFIGRHMQLETGIQNLLYVRYGNTKNGSGQNEEKSNIFNIGTNLSQAFDNFVFGIKWIL